LTHTLYSIAQRLGLAHDGPDVEITRPALADDTEAGTLVLATTSAYAAAAAERGAAALLLPLDLASPLPCLRSEQPRVAFARLLALFDDADDASPAIHPSAVIAPDADIHGGVSIGPNAVVERGAVIGEDAIILANAFIGHHSVIGARTIVGAGAMVLQRCTVGERVRVQAGAVIGSEGFGYEWDGAQHVRVPHIGTVVIEDDVEIGANCTIDRAKTGETRIGRGTKLDNLVQVGHGTQVGPFCLLAGQTGIAGSVTIGAGSIFGGQTGVVDNITIGPRAVFGAQTGVTKDVPGGQSYLGMPAREAQKARRTIIARDQLPEILRRLRALEKKIE
jgi:UDP-3-O-[3-hydroxymyristoyl] glucosamine N-acyltransferase